ncbi:MAG: diaminopimelate epimerase [Desulfobacterales bacterium]
MNTIPFCKMSGCGNDFILVDNRAGYFGPNDPGVFVRDVCRRKLSIGADGLILIEPSKEADFKWRFYNSDGSRAEMCGNGARCAARFAYIHGIAGARMAFMTDAGRVDARIVGTGVTIGMINPSPIEDGIRLDIDGDMLQMSHINTGVPHVVMYRPDADRFELDRWGPKIRFHQRFAPAGANVNVMRMDPEGIVFVRTYERGVEDETLACGTGAVACALVAAHRHKGKGPIKVKTKSGGMLIIHFERRGDEFVRVCLEGDARFIYRGELYEEGYGYALIKNEDPGLPPGCDSQNG